MAGARTCHSCMRVLRSHASKHSLETTRHVSSAARAARQTSVPVARLLARGYATAPAPATPIPNTPTAPATQPIAPNVAATTDATSDFAETYVAKEKSEILFKECARQADYIIPQVFERDGDVPKTATGEEIGEGVGWWYETCGLTPTFNTWFQITSLHMYLLTVRLRYLPHNRSTIWLQHLSDHFFYEAEHRMTLFHRISSRAIRNRYLKDLYNQWRGVQAAYDEGLVKGDAVLAAAIWRNIFKGDPDADWTKIAQATSYVRRGLRGLDRTAEDKLLMGKIKFAGPASEDGVVAAEARGIKGAFESEDEVQWAEWEKRKVDEATGKK